ncbi:uncharacterized protein [Haliotis asinina]|uniref:uncharacterized protein n=1 Tax=Haliotis asinina TaxID=109174 RepID=UPI003532117D
MAEDVVGVNDDAVVVAVEKGVVFALLFPAVDALEERVVGAMLDEVVWAVASGMSLLDGNEFAEAVMSAEEGAFVNPLLRSMANDVVGVKNDAVVVAVEKGVVCSLLVPAVVVLKKLVLGAMLDAVLSIKDDAVVVVVASGMSLLDGNEFVETTMCTMFDWALSVDVYREDGAMEDTPMAKEDAEEVPAVDALKKGVLGPILDEVVWAVASGMSLLDGNEFVEAAMCAMFDWALSVDAYGEDGAMEDTLMAIEDAGEGSLASPI